MWWRTWLHLVANLVAFSGARAQMGAASNRDQPLNSVLRNPEGQQSPPPQTHIHSPMTAVMVGRQTAHTPLEY